MGVFQMFTYKLASNLCSHLAVSCGPNLKPHKDVNNTNGVLCNQQVKEYPRMQYFGTTRPVHSMLTYILI